MTGIIRHIYRKISALLSKLIYRRMYFNPTLDKGIVDGFHKFYYDSYVWEDATYWLGFMAQKCPLDLWIYQEIIYKLKPDVIIETGTAQGGSALFLASMCDLVSNGKVLTIDIKDEADRPRHSRIQYLIGSSTSEEIVERVSALIGDTDKVLVILDSDHSKEHVLNELRVYSKFITRGSYLIVEDTNLNGRPVVPGFGPGPKEAVDEFLKETNDFVVDKDKEKFFLTFCPNGYLKRR
jgi:cephalosporin hydroxylase